MNNMHHKRTQGGMALIEALISILILRTIPEPRGRVRA